VGTKHVQRSTFNVIKLAFHDTDTDADTDILARIAARMSVSVSVSASWNASFTAFTPTRLDLIVATINVLMR